MKNTSLLVLSLFMLLCISCTHNNIDTDTGRVVGIINCSCDGKSMTGYYIITSSDKYLLSFGDEIQLPYKIEDSGIYGIPEYEIPFEFSYILIDSSSEAYIDYDLPVSNAMYPAFAYPCERFKQAKLTRIK